MAGDAEAVTQKVVQAAKDGDMTAARIIFDRLFPARRDNFVSFEMPSVEGLADVAQAIHAVIHAVSAGELTPIEGDQITKMIGNYAQATSFADFEARLASLEAQKLPQ